MKKRTPSVNRICTVAVIHFAQRGYDASSLNEIAAAAGIRKASLYAHFENKDALYMEAFSDALNMERDYAHQCFILEEEEENDLPGSLYCTGMAERYRKSVHLRFLLRSAYLPPQALHPQISVGYEEYLNQLQNDFTGQLLARKEGRPLSDEDTRLFGEVFLGIIDSLHVELLYGEGRRFSSRLRAFLQVLEGSLRAAENRGDE
ncbi:hypothetical protein CKG00_09235 [Morganella morganii]|uniref:HTH tetR-type domain-containing protein n=1 Tax=Morganella morganii TaxID=582 RepID=A0A433ZWM8_MORMO|nr:TetR/AcrR family transcriptional regulator [Morganella morganii]RUT66548.1 hypothetical protein CKG00_09235 [Morganella morganii]